MNPCAGATDLLVFEARPFSHLGTPPEIVSFKTISNIIQPGTGRVNRFLQKYLPPLLKFRNIYT